MPNEPTYEEIEKILDDSFELFVDISEVEIGEEGWLDEIFQQYKTILKDKFYIEVDYVRTGEPLRRKLVVIKCTDESLTMLKLHT